MHGGDGWTIHYPNGKHGHAYPGGGVRTHYENRANPVQSTGLILVGVIATVVLLVDDLSGVGAADNVLISGTAGCIIIGIDGFRGKICTECGEIWYGD